MARDNGITFKPSKSLIISIIMHVIFFGLLFTTLSFETKKPPITINLHQDPGKLNKIVQATLIDKSAIEKLNREKIERQRNLAQKQLEAEQAKVAALELEKQKQAKLEADKKAKQESELQIKKQVALQQQQLRQLAMEKLQAKQKAEKQQAEKNARAQQQAAHAKAQAVKSEHNRILAEQQAMLESEVEKYRAEFAAAIEENRILSAVFAPGTQCKLRIMLLPDGSILSVKVIESSGNLAYDEMSASAVYKSAPFIMPEDQELYAQLREIVLSFKNGE